MPLRRNDTVADQRWSRPTAGWAVSGPAQRFHPNGTLWRCFRVGAPIRLKAPKTRPGPFPSEIDAIIAPLTAERLHGWRRLLFSAPSTRNIAVGWWRDDRLGRMRVVSRHPTGQTVVHFEAPAADRLDDLQNAILGQTPRPDPDVGPVDI